jgi:hypothetical protein
MKFTITALALLCLCSFSTLAQTTYSVKGNSVDSVANIKLVNTSISILNAKDSTLRKFTRATANGSFSISNLNKGKFILLVTYPGYADYVEHFTLDSAKSNFNFGNINMNLKSRLLNEVLIKGTVAAIKIKGDTTEFNAKAYTIQPNSKVEDLLKQLPGIQVDKDGKITAQGQTVQKVLVDGEEFFGDDPTLVTKNIRGDMVDKVQLYDKKSDQAAFTGIDDGQKTKTINIKLKEDKKNGYFGKVDAGIGTDGFYEGQGLFNKFKGKKKFSVYGTFGNTGKTGLGWNDNNKLGTSDGLQFNDDGNAYFSGNNDGGLDSFSGRYDGQGIPVANTGGVHYDDKWKNDKYSLNTNYKVGSLTVDGTRDNRSRQNLPGDSTNEINTVSKETFNNYMFRQKLDATYSVKLDTTSTLKVSVDGTLKNSETRNSFTSVSKRADSTLINKTLAPRTLDNKVDQQLFNASALYTKKLKKVGRTISLNVLAGVTQNKADGFLNSHIQLYDTTGAVSGAPVVVDQRKTDNTKTSRFSTNLTYTEPITKALSVVLNYGISFNNSNADRRSYNNSGTDANPNYNLLDTAFSNHYIFNQTSNQGGVNFAYKKGKSNLRFGTRVSNVNFKQVDEITGDTRRRNFTNWNPQANYSYKFSTYSSLNIGYYGNQTQPTIDQLQPIKVNNDPLNITLGNPDLKPAFTNSFYGYYNMYKVISDQSIWLNGNYSFTSNPIVSNVVTDDQGRSTFQSINLNNKQQSNYSLGLDGSRKLGVLGLNLNGRVSTNGNIYYSMQNNELNRTNSNSYSGTIGLSKYKEKKYSIYLNGGPTYTVGQSSLQPDRNNNGRGFTADYYLTVYLPGKIQISSDGNYQYTAATQSFNTDFRQTIINASVTKSFFKGEGLKLILKGNDLLNQNSGFTRNASSTSYVENRYTTIRRYYMLSVVWDFSGMGGGTPKK